MKKILILLAICFILTAPLAGCRSQERDWISQSRPPIKIIPQPRQVKLKEPPCVFDRHFLIMLESTHTEDDRVGAELLQSDLKNIWGIEIDIMVNDASIPKGNKVVFLGVLPRDKLIQQRARRVGLIPNESLGEQGYLLDVTGERIFVLARHSRGLFYGLQSLRQLIQTKCQNLHISVRKKFLCNYIFNHLRN